MATFGRAFPVERLSDAVLESCLVTEERGGCLLNFHAEFIKQLEAEAAKGGWWADVLADPELFIALRGSYLDVYWLGQRLFHVRASASGLKVTTHEKYLLDPALAGQVSLTDGVFDIAGLIERAFVREYQGSGMPRKMQTISKMKATAGAFSGSEKAGCHEIAVRNPEVIDVEIAFPGIVSLDDGGDDKTAPRVDLAAVEPDGNDARLVFWEAKHYGNGELRVRLADVKSAPVCRQIRVYKKYLTDNQKAVEDSYTNVARNLVAIRAMGRERPLWPLIEEVGTGKRRLTLGVEPKVGLIIFGFDSGQRDQPGWKKHLQRLKDDSAISYVRPVGDAKNLRFRV
jgi:hypothetical protein